MILTKEIAIIINKGNIGIYRKINKDINIGDIINITTENLSKTSQQTIRVKCDICGLEQETTYHNYLRNYDKYKIYTCKKCSRIKSEKICLKKYYRVNFSKFLFSFFVFWDRILS